MVESVYWNVGPSQTAPYGAASSPKGRAKVASLRTMSNKIPFIGTPSRPTWREANSLPYSGLSKNLPAQLQFFVLLSKADMHIPLYLPEVKNQGACFAAADICLR